ncbi:hypothetical protein, partial [Nitratifractor sp.]
MKWKIGYATHAYWRDWRVVLDPKRFDLLLKSHSYKFDKTIVIINNIPNVSEMKRAKSMALKLKSLGLVDEYIVVDEYLNPSVLRSFNLKEDFWSMNPYFSTAQIAALHYMSKKG